MLCSLSLDIDSCTIVSTANEIVFYQNQGVSIGRANKGGYETKMINKTAHTRRTNIQGRQLIREHITNEDLLLHCHLIDGLPRPKQA